MAMNECKATAAKDRPDLSEATDEAIFPHGNQ